MILAFKNKNAADAETEMKQKAEVGQTALMVRETANCFGSVICHQNESICLFNITVPQFCA